MNDVKFYLDPAEKKMGEATIYLEEALAHIRAGKANVKILDGVKVDAYGSKMALSAVANISVPDARSIMITPWDKSIFRHIEKAIMDSNVGITPENNGEVIRETDCKAEREKAKVTNRNARREAIEGLKKAVKDGMAEDVQKDAEAKVQKIHDKFLKKVDELFAAKEKEILTV